MINHSLRDASVSKRAIPYPYNAMLAICSDLDETPDKDIYKEIMCYLNTRNSTALGDGVGLEVGNSIYFDMPSDQFAYWNTDDTGRSMVRELIKSGHIDSLHSFGDMATTRAHAEKALNELDRHGCKMEVWIDHSKAPSNFGRDIMRGYGDIPGSKVYHADLTCAYGIKYVWRGRVTSLTGQNTSKNFTGILDRKHPLFSSRTLLKEFLKSFVSHFGNVKFSMHKTNNIMRKTQLRSGHKVIEFIRSNPHWGGVSCGETADGISEVLTKQMLDGLVKRGGNCILYTHIGKSGDPSEPFNAGTRNALHLLSSYSRDKKILVTTTRRLLGYCSGFQDTHISSRFNDGCLEVNLSSADGIRDLAGLSLYIPDVDNIRVILNGREIKSMVRNGADHTGRESISFVWSPLEFPDL